MKPSDYAIEDWARTVSVKPMRSLTNEEILGVYYSGEDRFEMTGIVNNIVYNTDIDWIVVECNCIDIRKCKIV